MVNCIAKKSRLNWTAFINRIYHHQVSFEKCRFQKNGENSKDHLHIFDIHSIKWNFDGAVGAKFLYTYSAVLFLLLLPLYHHRVITTGTLLLFFYLSSTKISGCFWWGIATKYSHTHSPGAEWYYGVIICNVCINIIKMHAQKMERIIALPYKNILCGAVACVYLLLLLWIFHVLTELWVQLHLLHKNTLYLGMSLTTSLGGCFLFFHRVDLNLSCIKWEQKLL